MTVDARHESGVRARSWWMRAGGIAAWALRAVPRRYRFEAARLLARAVEPVLRRTTLYRTWPTRFDGARELALYGVMTLMDRQRVAFDPPLIVPGAELLHDDLAHGRGVLLLAMHQSLVTLIPRYLYDTGYKPLIVAASNTFPLVGAAMDAPAVRGSASLLVRVRNQLRAGGVVCAMLDVGGRDKVVVDTAAGDVDFNRAWLRLARRCQASVLFVWARAERKRIVVDLSRPAYAAEASDDDVIDAVIAHVRARIERMAGAGAAAGLSAEAEGETDAEAEAGGAAVEEVGPRLAYPHRATSGSRR